jgi:hypothetical protein
MIKNFRRSDYLHLFSKSNQVTRLIVIRIHFILFINFVNKIRDADSNFRTSFFTSQSHLSKSKSANIEILEDRSTVPAFPRAAFNLILSTPYEKTNLVSLFFILPMNSPDFSSPDMSSKSKEINSLLPRPDKIIFFPEIMNFADPLQSYSMGDQVPEICLKAASELRLQAARAATNNSATYILILVLCCIYCVICLFIQLHFSKSSALKKLSLGSRNFICALVVIFINVILSFVYLKWLFSSAPVLIVVNSPLCSFPSMVSIYIITRPFGPVPWSIKYNFLSRNSTLMAFTASHPNMMGVHVPSRLLIGSLFDLVHPMVNMHSVIAKRLFVFIVISPIKKGYHYA